jgi:hypothetical protein
MSIPSAALNAGVKTGFFAYEISGDYSTLGLFL